MRWPFHFGRWSLEELTPPWQSTTSIYSHILKHANQSEDQSLPDEVRDPGEIRFVSGGLDGVMGRHMAPPGEDATTSRAKLLLSALERLLERSTAANLKSLHEAAIEDSILPAADKFQQLAARQLLPRYGTRMAQTGRYFATAADRREAVKLGILLLGLAGDRSDAALLKTLAMNEEFTLYAAVALCNRLDEADHEQCLWELARGVHGWGRIQLVERLAQTEHPEIQAWMLREGFHNRVMDEYLAAICARTGKLHEALAPAAIDRALLDSTAGLLTALIAGGPAPDIDSYEHAPQALNSYVRHLKQCRDAGLDHLLAVHAIGGFLVSEGWDERFSRGWTEGLRDHLIEECRSILAWPKWRRQIEEGLQSDDDAVYVRAAYCARIFEMDTWAVCFERIRRAPLHYSAPWFELLQQTDEQRIDEVLAYARSVLPLNSVATGPGDLMGLGPGFEAEHVLDFLLQELKRFPQRGWEFIRTGLKSRVVRNRNMALNALLAWPRESWPAEAFSLLKQARAQEPNQDLQERMGKAIEVQ